MVSKHVSEGDQCFMCGEDNVNVLQSHHIVPSVFGGSDGGHNRVVLCANHHQAIHAIYSDRVFRRLGVSKVTDTVEDAEDLDYSTFDDLATGEQFEHLQRHLSEQTLSDALSQIYLEELDTPSSSNTLPKEAGPVAEMVSELQDEYEDRPGVPVEIVIDRCVDDLLGWDKNRVQNKIREQRDRGVIYSPDQDHLRTV